MDHIYFVYIPRHQNYSWKNYMKEFVEVTHEENFYLTEPLLKDIGGRACKRKHKSMLKNVISVRDSRQTFISPEEFLILFLALGLLLSGAWIL